MQTLLALVSPCDAQGPVRAAPAPVVASRQGTVPFAEEETGAPPPPHHQAQESVPATSGTSGACRAESTPRADELEDESAGFTANLLWKPSHLEQRLHIGVHLENRGKVSSGYRT